VLYYLPHNEVHGYPPEKIKCRLEVVVVTSALDDMQAENRMAVVSRIAAPEI